MSPVNPPPSGAVLSDDGLYRYQLWRTWDPVNPKRMLFVMLNPSTADAERDDPTIRRCIGFAKREGCGSLEVVNLYALRATKPAHLLDHPDPEGPDNYHHWELALGRADIVVAAWGASIPRWLPISSAANRGWRHDWYCLGITKDGCPRHPLFVPADQPLVPLVTNEPLWIACGEPCGKVVG